MVFNGVGVDGNGVLIDPTGLSNVTSTNAQGAIAELDAASGGVRTYKAPCRLATIGNHGLSGLAAIDGITPVAADRILVKGQTLGQNNGIYEAALGAWARAEDFDNVVDDEIDAGLTSYVQEGTVNEKTIWHLTTTAAITLGVTPLVFEELGGGIGGVTGGTDNALLRADGTGGSTAQASIVTLTDLGAIAGLVSATLAEQASVGAPGAGNGTIWVRNDTPTVPVFTDDTAADFNLLAWSPDKRPARVATLGDIANLAAGAPDTVDGVTVILGDRVLVWNQTAGATNGIYVVTVVGTGVNGTWVRAAGFNDAAKDHLEAGVSVYVQEGTSWGGIKFTLATTGAITIGATSLTFAPEGGLARTDATSTEVIASKAFAVTIDWSSPIDLRDHTHLSVWFDPTNLGGNTVVDVFLAWSDDGTTVPFDNFSKQNSDFTITSGTDGSFTPKPYTARFTTATGELVVNERRHLSYPKRGGFCRVGVLGDTAAGAYSVRAQRLTT